MDVCILFFESLFSPMLSYPSAGLLEISTSAFSMDPISPPVASIPVTDPDTELSEISTITTLILPTNHR